MHAYTRFRDFGKNLPLSFRGVPIIKIPTFWTLININTRALLHKMDGVGLMDAFVRAERSLLFRVLDE